MPDQDHRTGEALQDRRHFAGAARRRLALAGATAAAAAMLVTTAAEAASASTSAIHPGAQRAPASATTARPSETNAFNCTPAGDYQLCIGVNYHGANYIDNAQIDVKLPQHRTHIYYQITGPNFDWPQAGFTGGPGWAPRLTVPVNRAGAGWWCGYVALDGNWQPGVCVYAP